jgi:hypothetical protein
MWWSQLRAIWFWSLQCGCERLVLAVAGLVFESYSTCGRALLQHNRSTRGVSRLQIEAASESSFAIAARNSASPGHRSRGHISHRLSFKNLSSSPE